MLPPPKIRVGLIGLSVPPKGAPTGTDWAAQGHLPYLLASTKYDLVALHNSTTERARNAIEFYNLDPEKVRPYGNPEGSSTVQLRYQIVCARLECRPLMII